MAIPDRGVTVKRSKPDLTVQRFGQQGQPDLTVLRKPMDQAIDQSILQPMEPNTQQDPLYRTPQDKKQWDSKLKESSDQAIRVNKKSQIDQLLKRYDTGLAKQKQNRMYTAQRAKTLSITNPAAANIYLKGHQRLDQMPTAQFGQKQKLTSGKYANDKSQQGVVQTQQQMDSNSQVSRLYRDQLKNNGIQVPETSSAADIKKVFPFLSVDIKRDTQQRGQDITEQTAQENRLSRQSQGSRGRGSRQRIAEGYQKAGIGKVIIGGALAQDKAAAAGTGSAAQSTANAATIPHAFSPNKFLVSKPGIPPDPHRAKQVTDLGQQAARYQSVLQQARRVIQAAGTNPTVFNENWPRVQTAFAIATQRNIKAMGNGVANGADIQQAIKAIGSPQDAVTWLRSGITQKMDQALSSIPMEYNRVADANGFTQSDRPSATSQTLGTGGSQSSKQPINPATGAAANQIAGQYGFPAITGQNQPSTPGPAQPKSDFIPGKQYDTSNGPAIFVGINPQTGKRQWKAVSK